MRWARKAACLATGALAFLGAATASDLKGVRFGKTGSDATRIVLDVAGPLDYALSTDDEGLGRITLELKGVFATASSGTGQGHVGRYGVETGGAAVRARFDLARPARVKSHFLLAPKDGNSNYRLVIDLETAAKPSQQAKLPAAPAPVVAPQYEDLAPVIEAVTRPDAPAAPAVVSIIVIDAGHGGTDPGATSIKGIQEKTVTLAAARKLSEILQSRGRYRIVMTRADDTRHSLEQRAEAARQAGADLFISLHADSNPDPALRGGSVYTLSEEGTERSAREARAQEDTRLYGQDLKNYAPDVNSVIYDLAQNHTQDQSAIFAQMLLKRLKGVTHLVNNSHRQADLRVLLAPDVPAVLFELAYMSNATDVASLTSPAWREKAMTAVADAIDAYFEGKSANRHAALPAGRKPGAARF